MAVVSAPIHLPSRYRDFSPLAEGAMGTLLRARDTRDGRWVALKVARTRSADEERRLLLEARTLGMLSHPAVVRLLDVGVAEGAVYCSMELIEGRSLAELLAAEPPSIAEIRWLVRVAIRIVDALEYIHARDVVHRDLKPANVLVLPPEDDVEVERDGRGAAPPLADLFGEETPRIKLVDFGLARLDARGQRGAADTSGTPLYMPPEQVQAEACDFRADFYSLGALLYHLVTRTPPFTDISSIVAPRARARPAHELHAACPPRLSELIDALLQKVPHRRPSSAAQVRDALRDVVASSTRDDRTRAPRLLAPSFVGRTVEQDELIESVRTVAEGRGTCVRIAGASGIGKTWLLRRSGVLGRLLAEHGLRYVYRSLAQRADDSGLVSLADEIAEEIAPAVAPPRGRGRRAPEGEDPAATWRDLRARMREGPESTRPGAGYPSEETLIDASADLLRRAAEDGPWLLVVEDVEHADDFELSTLTRWTRLSAELPVALVVTWDTDAGGEPRFERFAAGLALAAAGPSWTLGGLSDGEIRELAEAMLYPRAPLGDDLADALALACEGHPRGAVRHLQHLWSDQALRLRAGRWELSAAAAIEAPQGDSFERRFELLATDERRIVTAAAAMRDAFRYELLVTVLELDHARQATLPEELERLALAGLLDRDDDGSFHLPPDAPRETVLASAAPAELARWHRRAADTLRSATGVPEGSSAMRIARHLEAAGEREEACRLYASAARTAAARYANRLACEALEHALRLTTEPAARSERFEEQGQLLSRVGDHDRALEAFRSALALHRATHGSDETRREEASLRREVGLTDCVARVLQRRGDLEGALALFREALERGGHLDDLRALALFRLGSLHLELADPAAAHEPLAESARIYERVGDRARLAEVQSHLGLLAKRQDRSAEAIAHFEAAVTNARASGDLLRVATTLNNLGNLHRSRGDHEKALEYLEQSIRERERCGDRQGLAICLNNVSRVHCFRGEYRLAGEETRAALRLFERLGDHKGISIASCNLGEILTVLGEFDEARELLRRTQDAARRWRLPPVEATALVNLAVLETEYGDYDRALAALERGIEHEAVRKPCELRAVVLGAMAAAAIQLGDLVRAETVLGEALDIATKLNLLEMKGTLVGQEVRLHAARGDPEEGLAAGAPWLKLALRRMALLGHAQLLRELGRVYRELGPDWADRTEDHFGRALAEFERMDSTQNVAETHAELASYWELLGEEEEVARHAESAAAVFGERPLTPRIRALLGARSTP